MLLPLKSFRRASKKSFTAITSEAQDRLRAYDWPGNVCEPANVMERAVVLGPGPQVTPHDLPPRVGAAALQTPAASVSYHAALDAYRREVLLRALAQAQGNHAAAAKALGLQRTYLQRLLKALGID